MKHIKYLFTGLGILLIFMILLYAIIGGNPLFSGIVSLIAALIIAYDIGKLAKW